MNRRYHVVGVAGVGMSALAQALLDHGHQVTGSDRYHDQGQAMAVLGQLAASGLRLAPQDGSAVDEEVEALVVSTAIEEDNRDLVRARALGVPVLHRAEMLARLCRSGSCVAISGTAGKTTVTGMVGWILEQLGEDPRVVNGGAVVDWQSPARVGSVRRGNSDRWVIEADESDRSLLQFRPDWSVVTNISRDHFEEDELVRLFGAFAGATRRAVICGEGVRARLLAHGVDARGLHEEVVQPECSQGQWSFVLDGLRFTVPLAGRHNALNASLAALLCRNLGKQLAAVRDALACFHGIERRLERVGVGQGVAVFDDYAHNPAKMAAAWDAVRESADRVVAVWRPHGFAPLSLMFDDLAATFSARCREGDQLFLLPVYYAGGTTHASVASADLALACRRSGASVQDVPDYQVLEDLLMRELQPGDAVLVMGARDPDLPVFARTLVSRLAG